MYKRSCSARALFSLAFLFIFSCFTVFAQDGAIEASTDGIPTDDASIAAGGKLFAGNCQQCHAVNEVVIGPALNNVWERQDLDWIKAWIKNSQAVIASGDPYGVALYKEYKNTVMTSYDFEDDQIMSILAWVKAEAQKVPETPVAGSSDGSGEQITTAGGGEYTTVLFTVLIVVLLLILLVLMLLISVIKKFLGASEDLDEADLEIVNSKFNFEGFVKSKPIIGLVMFLFVAILFKTLVDGLYGVGVQQGYQPNQPIAFSHAIHAGQYEIECQYCHTGVTKGKSANIPSANICMNCHTSIKTESAEIKKIYAAIDYDAETGTYGQNQKPIEWIRVHNLPDLAYFNHSQHVAVGGLECQTCHGPIEEMEVVKQHSLLTMGWCINCHRETEINSQGNEYYDKLVQLHESHSNDPMLVTDIGGLECSKCHY